MSLRSVEYELEPKLTGNSHGLFSKPSGKVERKSYADGGERIKISIRNLQVPDQSVCIIKVDGQEITQFPLIKGSGRLDNESMDPSSIPTLQVGQTVEVYVDGALLLSGNLHVD